ncbi:TetR/AcrR family transcriptional regulator [Microbacterium aquimaris]|uniref:TetR/AcrR family transcriptional regulator n=1 Tax=Microbacterium aquimaris TaxID=459816 RepID=A0ABU5N743_9MICO|nr:TetR/AcrR family transcriptional regulator [Microbacterium aquimaris]MDZ8161888.1 TetR/AcrR family transcriptional regulator [Microbacterium aquimaris]
MHEDPRFVRSRESLRSTLHRLVLTTPLAEISVSVLCREAGVHRTTFYRHARSVRDLAIAEFVADIQKLTTVPVEPSTEASRDVARRYEHSLQQVLELVAGERAVYRALFGSYAHDSFPAALVTVMRPQALKAVHVFRTQGVPGAPSTDHECEEAAAFIAGAFVGVIDAWVTSGETDATAAARRITHLMPGWWPHPDTSAQGTGGETPV